MRGTFILICIMISILAKAQLDSLSIDFVANKLALNSPEAKMYKLQYENEVLNFDNYKKSLLPSFSFNINPLNFNRSLRLLQDPNDGGYSYIEDYSNNSNIGINIRQKVPFTGGEFNLRTDMSYLYEFSKHRSSFNTTPIAIGYTQQLIGSHKMFKMEEKIQDLKFQAATNTYCHNIAKVQQESVRLYIISLLDFMECKLNYSQMVNNDTLQAIGEKKLELNRITEYEYNQIRIQCLNSKYEYEKALTKYFESKQSLITYLDLSIDDFEIVFPKFELPLSIEYSQVLHLVNKNSPFYLQEKINQEQDCINLYSIKLDNRINGNISINYGINQYAENFIEAYKRGNNRQSIMLGFQIPVFQWGINRNKIRIAQNNYDKSIITRDQKYKDFESEIRRNVKSYNSSVELWFIAEQFYHLAKDLYGITVQKFALDKLTVYDLTTSQNELTKAMNQYYLTIKQVFLDYYLLRTKALYDFQTNEELSNILLK